MKRKHIIEDDHTPFGHISAHTCSSNLNAVTVSLCQAVPVNGHNHMPPPSASGDLNNHLGLCHWRSSCIPPISTIFGLHFWNIHYLCTKYEFSGFIQSKPLQILITGRLPWQPAGIKFTHCVSGQKSAFSLLQEKLCIGSKNNGHLLELSQRSLSACKVWGRSNYVRRLWERKLVFFVCHAWSACAWGHSSNKYCVTVYWSIFVQFSALF